METADTAPAGSPAGRHAVGMRPLLAPGGSSEDMTTGEAAPSTPKGQDFLAGMKGWSKEAETRADMVKAGLAADTAALADRPAQAGPRLPLMVEHYSHENLSCMWVTELMETHNRSQVGFGGCNHQKVAEENDLAAMLGLSYKLELCWGKAEIGMVVVEMWWNCRCSHRHSDS